MNARTRLDFKGARERMERALRDIESDIHSPEEAEKIYLRRAALLAQPIELVGSEGGESIVIFLLGKERYAVLLASVSEIIAPPPVAPAPGAPGDIDGLIQVRGDIRVVWNPRKLLGLAQQSEPGNTSTALLLRIPGGEAAVLVDEVEDIRTVRLTERRPAPADAVQGAWMTHDLIIVLNPAVLWPA
jgi:chemotaxis signal transduction protein